MSIIGQVEKKHWKVKVLNLSIHVILILGAITMVYPLLLMISGSFKSDVDFKRFNIIPEYLGDDTVLFRKHLFTKYNRQTLVLQGMTKDPNASFDNLLPPDSTEYSQKRVDDYAEFLKKKRQELPHNWYLMGMASEYGVYPLNLRKYREYFQKKYGNNSVGLEKFNNEYGTDFGSWVELSLPAEFFVNKRASSDYSKGVLRAVYDFKKTLNPLSDIWWDLDGSFISSLRRDCGRNLQHINEKLDTKYNKWSDIYLDRTVPENPKLAKAWEYFVRNDINMEFLTIDPKTADPAWRVFLKGKYAGNIEALNGILGTKYQSFDEITIPPHVPTTGQSRADWTDFVLEKAPIKSLSVRTLGQQYREWLTEKYGSLENLNKTYGNGFSAFDQVTLPHDAPGEENLEKSKDWNQFVTSLDSKDIGLIRQSSSDYRKHLEKIYTGTDKCNFEMMSNDYKRNIKNENYVPSFTEYPNGPQDTDKARKDYLQIVRDAKFAKMHRLPHPEQFQKKWEEFLAAKYDTIDSLNRAWKLAEADWNTIALPSKEYEWNLMLQHRSMLIKEYLKRNYLMVVDTLFTNGNAAINTLIYCFLAVFAALLVNPLCAYGLSRYKPASSYKILLFLMLPMAFPGMVLGIPQFLLIKDFGLLNTFAALILPGMANGYSIFLLKGFFDSLPKELFESAAIDGASEWVVFWHIAMGLSTPILSVIALGAFTGAYGNFMLAFLLCQESSMWTMMVYLYQLQQTSSQAVGFAALIVAAVPTLIVFIFCQNIIIKGIVVPTEK